MLRDSFANTAGRAVSRLAHWPHRPAIVKRQPGTARSTFSCMCIIITTCMWKVNKNLRLIGSICAKFVLNRYSTHGSQQLCRGYSERVPIAPFAHEGGAVRRRRGLSLLQCGNRVNLESSSIVLPGTLYFSASFPAVLTKPHFGVLLNLADEDFYCISREAFWLYSTKRHFGIATMMGISQYKGCMQSSVWMGSLFRICLTGTTGALGVTRSAA